MDTKERYEEDGQYRIQFTLITDPRVMSFRSPAAVQRCHREVEWRGVVIPEAEMCDFVGPDPKALWVEDELRKMGL